MLGIRLGDRVFGHLETTPESALLILEHSLDDLEDSQWVQNPEKIAGNEAQYVAIDMVMGEFLEALRNPG